MACGARRGPAQFAGPEARNEPRHAYQAHLRALGAAHAAAGPFAAVLACDNAVPHLLSDPEILQALRECHALVAPGGVLVLSLRDYAAIARRSPDLWPHAGHRPADRLIVAVQVGNGRATSTTSGSTGGADHY